MRFIAIIGIITISKCINEDVLISTWGDNAGAISVIATIVLAMDVIEFVKKMSK